MGIDSQIFNTDFLEKSKQLSDEEKEILKELKKNGSMLPTKIAAQLLISPLAIYRMLEKLENLDLISKVRSEKKEIFATEGEEYIDLSNLGMVITNLS